MGNASEPSGMYAALRQEADKQAYVDWIFDSVAARYDMGNDLMSLGWHTRWKHRLLDYADPQPGMRVLDIACGTGDVTWMLAQRMKNEGEVIGSDINAAMMAEAEPKRPAGIDIVSFVENDAAAMPFEDDSFDMITCAYAGRGFPDWPGVVKEAFRVLKPGGSIWNLDFARPPFKPWDMTYRGWMMASGAVLGAVVHRDPRTYMYIPASMAHYPGQRWLQTVMDDAGFQTELTETWFCLMAYNRGIKPL